MKRLTIFEYERVALDRFPAHALKELEALDKALSESGEPTIFNWNLKNCVKVKNYVGVIDVQDFSIEILPKIDSTKNGETLAKNNLLFMLSVAKKLPFKFRKSASLSVEDLPLLDVLIYQFVSSLLEEFRKGVSRNYTCKSELLQTLKGKINFSKSLSGGFIDPSGIHCEYDEYSDDNLLNKIFKATFRKLNRRNIQPTTHHMLMEAVNYLDSVEDTHIVTTDFRKIDFNRNTERFESHLDFCHYVLFGMSPSPTSGAKNTFTFLFPMERLFEEFIGNFIKNNSSKFGLEKQQIHLQALGKRRWLLRDEGAIGRFRLKPDIFIESNAKKKIIDTKWKKLLKDKEDKKNGVSQSDIYQLYAYSMEYCCNDNVLLFPKVAEISKKTYTTDNEGTSKQLRIETIDLNIDLKRNRDKLIEELQSIIGI